MANKVSVEEEKRGETKAAACWTGTGDVGWLSKCSPHNWTATTERGWFRVYLPFDGEQHLFSNLWTCNRAQILPYVTLCWRPSRVLASPWTRCAAGLLRSRPMTTRSCSEPLRLAIRQDELMVFGEDKLVSIQKSVAAQVSGRLLLLEEFGEHKESKEVIPAGFSAMDRAKVSTPNIFIAVNGQTCRRFLPRSLWRCRLKAGQTLRMTRQQEVGLSSVRVYVAAQSLNCPLALNPLPGGHHLPHRRCDPQRKLNVSCPFSLHYVNVQLSQCSLTK